MVSGIFLQVTRSTAGSVRSNGLNTITSAQENVVDTLQIQGQDSASVEKDISRLVEKHDMVVEIIVVKDMGICQPSINLTIVEDFEWKPGLKLWLGEKWREKEHDLNVSHVVDRLKNCSLMVLVGELQYVKLLKEDYLGRRFTCSRRLNKLSVYVRKGFGENLLEQLGGKLFKGYDSKLVQLVVTLFLNILVAKDITMQHRAAELYRKKNGVNGKKVQMIVSLQRKIVREVEFVTITPTFGLPYWLTRVTLFKNIASAQKDVLGDFLRMVVTYANCDAESASEMYRRLGFLIRNESEIMFEVLKGGSIKLNLEMFARKLDVIKLIGTGVLNKVQDCPWIMVHGINDSSNHHLSNSTQGVHMIDSRIYFSRIYFVDFFKYQSKLQMVNIQSESGSGYSSIMIKNRNETVARWLVKWKKKLHRTKLSFTVKVKVKKKQHRRKSDFWMLITVKVILGVKDHFKGRVLM